MRKRFTSEIITTEWIIFFLISLLLGINITQLLFNSFHNQYVIFIIEIAILIIIIISILGFCCKRYIVTEENLIVFKHFRKRKYPIKNFKKITVENGQKRISYLGLLHNPKIILIYTDSTKLLININEKDLMSFVQLLIKINEDIDFVEQ